LRAVLPSLECELQDAHARGRGALVLRISRWNGLSSDAQLTVAIVSAVDGTSALSLDCGQMDADQELVENDGITRLPEPSLDGFDRVCVDAASLEGGDPLGTPIVITQDAWMANGTLVARLPAETELLLPTDRARLRLRLSDGVVVARLATDYSRIEGGTLGGRWAVDDIVDASPDFGVCDVATLVDLYSEAADLLDPSSGGSPTQCDAVSVGIPYTGVSVSVAGVAAMSLDTPAGCALDAVPEPVEACCGALPSAAGRTNCESYWAAMP
jgi:hypothetical protein